MPPRPETPTGPINGIPCGILIDTAKSRMDKGNRAENLVLLITKNNNHVQIHEEHEKVNHAHESVKKKDFEIAEQSNVIAKMLFDHHKKSKEQVMKENMSLVKE
jgi:hypothetical protein